MEITDISRILPDTELVGVLGTGPFGSVHLARSKTDVEYSAVKIVYVPSVGDASDYPEVDFLKMQQELAWEMSMYRTVSSPVFVKPKRMVIKRSRDDLNWVCVIRLPLLTPLSEYMKKFPDAKNETVRMAKELCAAIAGCSNLGLIHGDIKPSNVFVDENGHYVLQDFGLRRCIGKPDIAVFDSRTTDYDAPEVNAVGKFFAVSDIYSLGMCMAYCLNGCVMPSGKNLNFINCNDPDLMKLVRKATSYNPRDRYRSAGDMLAALDRLDYAPSAIRRADALKAALAAVERPPVIEEDDGDEEKAEPIVEVGSEKPRRIDVFIAKIKALFSRDDDEYDDEFDDE